MATVAEKQLAQDLVRDWIGEEAARAGEPFVLQPDRVAEAYGLDADAVEAVCEEFAAAPDPPLAEIDDGWVVEP
mgnify:CR=1 FL=1